MDLDCSVNGAELPGAAQAPGSSSGLNRSTLCPHRAQSPAGGGRVKMEQEKTEMSQRYWEVQQGAWERPTQNAGGQRTLCGEGDLKNEWLAKSWPPKCHVRIRDLCVLSLPEQKKLCIWG